MNKITRAFAIVAAVLAVPSAALAQSSPGLTYGQVPTAAQWNSYFAAKQDVLGYTPVNKAGDVMIGRLVTAPSNTTQAGFNITPGVAPSGPRNGDMWITAAGLYVWINGSTSVLPVDQTITLTGDVTGSGFPSITTTVSKIAGTTVSGTTGTTNVVFSSAPTVVGGSFTALSALAIRSSGIGAFDLTFANSENMTAGRTLSFALSDANRTINLSGNLTISGATTLPTIAQGDIWYGSAAGVMSALGKSATATRYLANTGASNDPAWDLVNLANGVTGTLAAAQFPALTGDVTTTAGSLATTIAANAVLYSKFQQVAASSLVGNATGSLANATGITVGATLTFSGSALQTVAHTGDVTTSANSFATILVNIPTGVTMAGYLAATDIAAPTTPGAGVTRLYVDSTGKRLHDKNDAGVIGTTVVGDSGAANNYISAIDPSTGAITKSQPACATLSNSGAFCSSTDAANLTGTVNSARVAGSYTGITAVGALTAGSLASGFTTVGVTVGGTGTPTQFTTGSVVFAGASGVYTQDNAKLFYNDSLFRLGIGTASPSASLHVNNGTTAGTPISGTVAYIQGADGTSTTLGMDAFGITSTSILLFRQANGTAASPTQTLLGSALGYIGFRGYNNGGAFDTINNALIYTTATESHTATAQGADIAIYTTPNGTATAALSATFQASGGVSIGSAADPGVNNLSVAGIYKVGATSGLSATKTVRASGGAADCTLIFTGGIITGGSC
jgi:hypothetical protein